MTLILDIETDGLHPSKIHVCVTKDLNTGIILSFQEDKKESLKKYLKRYDTIIGHNALSFDIPILNRLWSMEIEEDKIFDTLLVSYLVRADIKGGHSLRSWGERFNYPKIEFEDFENLSPEMIKYCTQDVNITGKLYKYLVKLIKTKKFSDKSVLLEHKIRSIINKQQDKGFLLDVKKAHFLLSEVKQKADLIERDVLKEIPYSIKQERTVNIRTKKDGGMSSIGLKQIDNWQKVVGGDFNLVSFEPFNLASPKQIIEHMEEYGWKPIDYTPKGSPRINEKNLASVSSSAPKAIQRLAEWKMLQTRYKTVETWLDEVDENDRVHGRVITMGAVTSRMTHAKPNMANIVSSGKPFGVECRECWTVPGVDKVLVGMDAKGLELRMLAHYMNDKDFTEAVISGDPHTLNQKAAGLPTRSAAKTFIYAFLYGAGSAKIGSIINGSSSAGEALKTKFLSNVPKLNTLIKSVNKSAGKGHIKGLDGRRLYVRHRHAALNTLLQGAGAIVCKQWAVFVDEEIDSRQLDANLVNTIHDEQQYECSHKDAEELCFVADYAIQKVGEYYNMTLPLNADAKIGRTWAETH
tara:strand:+ start:2073 stop:3809 length:1737 start_codon:yes stop_codon:yes gene_type:complete